MKSRCLTLCLVLLATSAASAELTIPGSDGSDGAFNPTENTIINLGQAAQASWNTSSPQQGQGVFDPAVRAVVFKYASVTIPAGVTVTFLNHPSNAPVVWLVQGTVDIAGTLSVNGTDGYDYGQTARNASGGPGGFYGGRGRDDGSDTRAAGGGPGGGSLANDVNGAGGSHATAGGGASGPTYGRASLLPLIGGSGGAGASGLQWQFESQYFVHGAGGGGGGGALLIACNTVVRLRSTGQLTANGGRGGRTPSYAYGVYGWHDTAPKGTGGGGAGGGIRVVADSIQLDGGTTLTALSGVGSYVGTQGSSQPGGYDGGLGRIRLEYNQLAVDTAAVITPAPSTGEPGALWPDSSTPWVRAVSLNSMAINPNPSGGLMYPCIDLVGTFSTASTLVLQSGNIPDTAIMTVRVTSVIGDAVTVEATNVGPNQWQATITVPFGVVSIQARAQW